MRATNIWAGPLPSSIYFFFLLHFVNGIKLANGNGETAHSAIANQLMD
jgi:hypothetical protein